MWSRVVRRAPRQQVEEVSESTTFLYIGPLVQTTSGNASKAGLSSKSDWTLSRRRADIARAAKKVAITFDPNAFSEIHESSVCILLLTTQNKKYALHFRIS